MALCARPRLRHEGGPGARPLRAALRGPATAARRARDLGRREVTAAGARPPPPDPCAGPGRPALCEFEYRRGGTLAYLAAWDVHHANLFGRVEQRTGIEPFGRLVESGDDKRALRLRPRVFWIVDNGSSHAGKASIERLEGEWKNLRLIHLPIHASWLNQIELYFSIVQRKALTPNDFGSLDELRRAAARLPGALRARSPDPSSGPSPAPTSIACSPASPSTRRSSSWQPERTCGRVY